MSGLDGIDLDAEGFVDMDQFPDDGTDLVGAQLDQLRSTLHADPVDEPTPEQWEALIDDVVGLDVDTGPFAVDDADVLPDEADAGTDGVAPDDVESADPGDADPGEDAVEDGADGVADALDIDLDVDDAFDLGVDDAPDDAFAPDAADDGAPDLGPDVEDLL